MLQDSSAATQLVPRHWEESEGRPAVEVARMPRVALASLHVVSFRQFGGKLLYVDSRCPWIPHVGLVCVRWVLIRARPRLRSFTFRPNRFDPIVQIDRAARPTSAALS